MPRFEIHAGDVAAAKAFYGGLFDWSFEPLQGASDDVEYYVISGGGLSSSGGLSGGLLKRPGPDPAPGGPIRGSTMTFEIEDCDASYAWALKNGGGQALPPMGYPDIGRVAYVEDGQGNVVGMVTPEGDN
ncbi:hypothetical protein MWU52_04875 [Jannaschia sp. S6380]|uniref:VOC family protein n=1 Tax=Jannaschia sp. S6380 TaxID=2926408 RepID=UPI001FF2E9D9|nr:hypothetical protein [Jannaschia sp. S6380]MCK0166879.1 hypothetical protein [Jannaschia sp. S6380]